MNRIDLKVRTREYALSILHFYTVLPKAVDVQIIGKQLIRSGTSVGAQYREACRARSNAEFVSKIETGLQELDESMYWLELLEESDLLKREPEKVYKSIAELMKEADELIAIFVSCVKKVKNNSH